MTIAWTVLRRTPEAPRAAVHPVTLLVLLLVQGTYDWFLYRGFPGF
jgi:hypothetical protein